MKIFVKTFLVSILTLFAQTGSASELPGVVDRWGDPRTLPDLLERDDQKIVAIFMSKSCGALTKHWAEKTNEATRELSKAGHRVVWISTLR